MKVSILIPVLNEEKALLQSAAYLSQLRKHGHEVIICDGGSIDNSPVIARNIADIVIRSPAGRARQMNNAAAVASGDVLLFLHIDSHIPVNAPELIANTIGKGYQWGRFTVSIDSKRLLLRVVSFMMNLRSRVSAIVTGDQCLFVTRSVFQQLGGFSDIPLMEDIELSSRLRVLSRPAIIPEKVITSARRWYQHGVVRTILLMWKLRWRYWRGESASQLADDYYPGRLKAESYAVYILARSAGEKLKTRLSPVLTASERRKLHLELTGKIIESAKRTGYPVILWVTDVTDSYMRRLASEHSVVLMQQSGDDLGQRMRNAIAHGLTCYNGVILAGTDCPGIDENYLEQAVCEMRNGSEIVIGPAEDGGYVLLAARRLYEAIFENMPWGENNVLDETISMICRANLAFSLLDNRWDIDRPEDYHRYISSMKSLHRSGEILDQEVAANG